MENRDEYLVKHLEFILGIIERLARNSFALKGWSVTLIAAVFLLAVRGAEPALAMAAGLLPSFTFWGLDAYFLRQERMFRALYDNVRRAAPSDVDRFNLDAQQCSGEVSSWMKTLLAKPVLWFHASVVLVVIVALAFFSLTPIEATQVVR